MTSDISPSLQSLVRPIGWFKHDPKNARKHNKRNLKSIADSLREFGQQKPVVALDDGTVIAGNGTLDAAKSMGWDSLATVVFADKDKASAYAIADNRSAELAEWDHDVLAQTLKELSDQSVSLESLGFDRDIMQSIFVEPHTRMLLNLDDNPPADGAEEKYTTKIVSPIYEPKGVKPHVQSLVDTAKTDALVADINKSDVPEDVKGFLRLAAQRHTVFNFRRIADFYAHSPAEVQDLFERSALVIIDFNKAIELGFVKLSERIEGIISKEHEARGDDEGEDDEG